MKGQFFRTYAEEILLLLFLALDLLGILYVLPPDIEFFDKIIAWSLMAMVFYAVKLSQLFFGVRKKLFDILFLLAMFMFASKDFLQIVAEVSLLKPYFMPFYATIMTHAQTILFITFYLAGIMMILLSVHAARNFLITTPSLLSALGEQKLSGSWHALVLRWAKIFILMNTFFIIIFNLVIEWIALLEDDVLAIITVILIVKLILKYKHHANSSIVRALATADKFYTTVLNQLQQRERIPIVICAMLILHLLTDVVIFVLPLLGVGYIPDFSTPLISHVSIWDRLFSSESFAVSALYLINSAALLLLMVLPACIWYLLYTNKKERIHFAFPLFLLCLFIPFIVTPSFMIAPLDASRIGLVGVDMGTIAIGESSVYILLLVATLLILSPLWKNLDRPLLFISLLCVLYFFVKYFLAFAKSLSNYYLSQISVAPFFVGFYLFLFFFITLAFYVGGILYFILAAEREFDFL